MLRRLFENNVSIAYKGNTRQGVGRKYFPVLALEVKNCNGDDVLKDSNGMLEVDYLSGIINMFGNNESNELTADGFANKIEEVRYFKKGEFVVFDGDSDVIIDLYRRLTIINAISSERVINAEIIEKVGKFARDYRMFLQRNKAKDNPENRYDMELELPKSAEQLEGLIEMSELEKLVNGLPEDSKENKILPGSEIDIIFPSSEIDVEDLTELANSYTEQGKLNGVKLQQPGDEYTYGRLMTTPAATFNHDAVLVTDNGEEKIVGGFFDASEIEREICLILEIEDMNPSLIVIGDVKADKETQFGKYIGTQFPMQLVTQESVESEDLVLVSYNGGVNLDSKMMNNKYYIAGVELFEEESIFGEMFQFAQQLISISGKTVLNNARTRRIFETYLQAKVEEHAQTYNNDDWKVIGVSLSPIGIGFTQFGVDESCSYRLAATYLVSRTN